MKKPSKRIYFPCHKSIISVWCPTKLRLECSQCHIPAKAKEKHMQQQKALSIATTES